MIHLHAVREAYNALYKADKPLITTIKDVKIIDNPYWGIEGGGTVDITYMYITMPKTFARAVPLKSVLPPKGVSATVDESGFFTNEEFKNFPVIYTFNNAEKIEEVLADKNASPLKKVSIALSFGVLSTRQANMMSYLGSYLINEAWDGVYADGKEYFGGFENFFS